MGTLRAFSSALSSITASFPTTAYTPLELWDENLDAGASYNRTDTGTVPAATPYVLTCELVPLAQYGVTVTVGGNSRAIVRPGDEDEGLVGVDFVSGMLYFDSTDAGLAVSVTYRGRGTAPDATLLNRWQKEIYATQNWLLTTFRNEAPFGHLIASKTGCNLKSSGQIEIASSVAVPYWVTGFRLFPTSVSGVTTYPWVSLGSNDNVTRFYDAREIPLTDALSSFRVFPSEDREVRIGTDENDDIVLNVSTVAVGTAFTVTAYVYGIRVT